MAAGVAASEANCPFALRETGCREPTCLKNFRFQKKDYVGSVILPVAALNDGVQGYSLTAWQVLRRGVQIQDAEQMDGQ